MSRIFIALTALSMTVAVPAMAQDAQPMPAPSDPTMQPPMNEPAPAPEAAPAPAPSKADQVKAVVDSEFPAYDADKDGNLSKAEFTKWVSALREKSGATSTADDAKAKKWLADAFTAADADKSMKVSKTEMSNFLMG
jgi:EF hand